MAHEEPGHTVPEPLLTNIPPGYMYGVLLLTIVGCAIMRKIKNRWPTISNLRLILVTYAIAFVFDFIMEGGLILLPVGFYSYPPGAIQSLSFNAGTYYQWPVYEGADVGAASRRRCAACASSPMTEDAPWSNADWTASAAGSSNNSSSASWRSSGGVSACFFLFYNVPATWLGMHGDPWPEDVQKRSYFNPGICGEGTDRPCPNPELLPYPTKHSGYINHDGEFVAPPDGAEIPPVVPIEHGQ